MDSGSPGLAALRRVGLRVTASPLAVFTALAASTRHASVDAVISAVRERLGDGSAQTVYNVLARSPALGWCAALSRRASQASTDSASATTTATLSAVGDASCLMAADHSGDAIDEAEAIDWAAARSVSR